MRAFVLYADTRPRRVALDLPPGAAERYVLYGLDELIAAGFAVGHNLEPGREAGLLTRAVGAVLDRAVRLGGGSSGDFTSVLGCLRELRAADVVFSTVDRTGIPVAFLRRLGIVRTPVVYVAIGLPERVAGLRPRMKNLYRSAFRRLDAILAYGAGEADAIRAWLGEGGPRVVFVPFGVDTEAFRSAPAGAAEVDVLSVGADPRRDFGLLLEVAHARPEWSFEVVATFDGARALEPTPGNVLIRTDVPLATVRERLEAARVVALPVRENSYSGATTVLLQAMACGKPVVVSRTAAIERGYELEDGRNCRLVPPGDAQALEEAVASVLADPAAARQLGTRARETVEQHLGWERFTRTIRGLLEEAARTAAESR